MQVACPAAMAKEYKCKLEPLSLGLILLSFVLYLPAALGSGLYNYYIFVIIVQYNTNCVYV